VIKNDHFLSARVLYQWQERSAEEMGMVRTTTTMTTMMMKAKEGLSKEPPQQMPRSFCRCQEVKDAQANKQFFSGKLFQS
jgi:hypothetical protein